VVGDDNNLGIYEFLKEEEEMRIPILKNEFEFFIFYFMGLKIDEGVWRYDEDGEKRMEEDKEM